MSEPHYRDEQVIRQLPKLRGSYFYVVLTAETVDQFPQQRKTRLICELEGELSFRCGLNHLGDGNFFIILNRQNLKKVGKALGDDLRFAIHIDPDPLGVAVPEVLTVLLDQDPELREQYESLSMGKKRHVIHSIKDIKNIDLQVAKAQELIRTQYRPQKR